MESDLEIQLKELNSRLVKENKKLRKEKEKLKNERDYFETEKKNIGEQLDGFYVEMGNMHLRNRKLQTECFELKEQIDSLQKEKTALELNGTKLESEIERLNLHIQKAIQLEFDLILEKQRSEQALRSEISLLKSNTSETIELKYQVKLLIASLPLYGAELKCHVEESIKSISLEKLRAKNEEIEALEASQRCYAEEIDAKEALILKLTNQVKAYMAEKKEIIENYEEDLEQAQEKEKRMKILSNH
uniref:Shootin-1 n=1 Tax=Caenorhabditis tropicalis TaxID=1561998 RepID=A0A1I7TPL2_9PELO